MARDVMTVRLHLPQIRVLEVVEDTPGALVVVTAVGYAYVRPDGVSVTPLTALGP